MLDDETVDRILETARKTTSTIEYFFENLTSSDWLEPLERRGYFKSPPEPIPDGDGFRVPAWPESRYLARVAQDDPESVARIILNIPRTNNFRVHDDIGEAACKLPGPLAAKVANHEIRWLQEQPFLQWLGPQTFGRLVQHLVEEGRRRDSFRLAQVLLEIRAPAPRSDDYVSSHPVAKLGQFEYKEFLRLRIPTLFEAFPDDTFQLLNSLLDKAVRIESQTVDSTDAWLGDHSYIARPAIEDHPDVTERHAEGLLEDLLIAVRDASLSLVDIHGRSIEEVITLLESHSPTVFRRLSLHLLTRFAEEPDARDLITARLTSSEWFGEMGLHHEYLMLLRRFTSSLTADEVSRVVELAAQEAAKDDDEAYGERGLLRWLNELQKVLPQPWIEEAERLKEKHGEVSNPEFLFGPIQVGWVRNNSPLSAEQMEAMTPAELIRFATTWKPEDHGSFFERLSWKGFGDVVSSITADDPSKLQIIIEEFADLAPAFAWGFFSGLHKAIEEKKEIDWEPALRLARRVLTEHEDNAATDFHEPSWDSAERTAIDAIELGLKTDSKNLHIGFRELVWQCIFPATESLDPTPEHEAKYGGSNMDPLTLSLNTMRGKAMHAMIAYALWLRRNGVGGDFKNMPEVHEVLNTHLEPSKDSSVAVRAVYGQFLPWLFLLDRDWTISNLIRILGEEQFDLGWMAWDTYICYVQPFNDIFVELAPFYARAIDFLGEERPMVQRTFHPPDEALGTHLMTYYWGSKLELDEDGLLARFFQRAPAKISGQAVESIGRGLGDADPENTVRPKALWEWRVASGEMSQEEMESFGWWFNSKALDPVWALTQLKTVLERARKIDAGWLVVERLAELVLEHPDSVMQCLRLMIEGEHDPWSIDHWRDNIRLILRSALQATSDSARQMARDVIDILASKGYWEYSQLVS